MPSSLLNWHGPRYLALIEAETGRRLDAWSILILNEQRRLLSVAASVGGRGRRVYVASRPGEPPRKRTGRLRASFTWEKSGRLQRRIGTNYKLAKALELGSRTTAPRPSLRVSFRTTAPRGQAIMARPIRLP